VVSAAVRVLLIVDVVLEALKDAELLVADAVVDVLAEGGVDAVLEAEALAVAEVVPVLEVLAAVVELESLVVPVVVVEAEDVVVAAAAAEVVEAAAGSDDVNPSPPVSALTTLSAPEIKSISLSRLNSIQSLFVNWTFYLTTCGC
jgi:hypothetical protein